MATVPITIQTGGNPSPDPASVKVGDTVTWTNQAGSEFSVNTPHNVFHENTTCIDLQAGATSVGLKVKRSAATGNHQYTVSAGPCSSHPGTQQTDATILVQDSGHEHHHHDRK